MSEILCDTLYPHKEHLIVDANAICSGIPNTISPDDILPHETVNDYRKRMGLPKAEDNVNHPSHYTAYKGVEVIDLTEQMNFNRGNAVKYICRAGLKAPETELEDLQKARWYLDREINRIIQERKQ